MENTMMERRERPRGVTLMATFLGIEGLLEIIGGIIIIIATNALGHNIVTRGHTVSGRIVDTIGIGLGSVGIVVGVLTLLFVFGLLSLQRWAYWGVILVEGFNLLKHVFELVRHTGSPIFTIAAMIIPAVILIYFLGFSSVRRAFRI